ncbi:MAG: amidohydrolase family protein, partial [Candidatus Zipacnadales bacterium]
CYGTYARFLGKYVREEGLLSLAEAVRKCTSLPASRLRLADRGMLKEGAYADLVVFDPERIAERGDYQHPHRYPEGLETVIVNGTPVILQGQTTGARGGSILRLTTPC